MIIFLDLFFAELLIVDSGIVVVVSDSLLALVVAEQLLTLLW